jgi:hypothetical protein
MKIILLDCLEGWKISELIAMLQDRLYIERKSVVAKLLI